MESTQENTPKEDILEIKVYVPINEITERQQGMIDDALLKHPRDRKYLSNTTHSRIFAPSKNDADDIIDHAKANNWNVSFDKTAREITIKISSEDIANTDDESKSLLDALQFLSPQGDIHLDVKNTKQQKAEEAEAEEEFEHAQEQGNVHAEAIVDPAQKTGFVKSNEEKRVGRGNPIPIQDPTHGYNVLELAEAYQFPEGDGEGETIGIIELGGEFAQSDLDTFFETYHIPVPEIQIVGEPSVTPVNDNVEVTSDIQIAGLLAPKAKIVVYYATSILKAMKMALADTKNKLSVISISWAGSELDYSMQEITELNNVFYEASLKGITIVGASGDHGAMNNKQYPNVNVPVNSPFVLACGGTQIALQNDQLQAEIVWNESTPQAQIASGGGFSQRIAEHPYQHQAIQNYIRKHPEFEPYQKAGGRGIPDVAANAADASGYALFFEGNWIKLGGTSLATPLWAALIARMNQNLGYRLGCINSHLYQLTGTDAFHQVLEGNNNLYVADLGWNPCTGLGTPNGEALMNAIESLK